jgi:hypothetical protein
MMAQTVQNRFSRSAFFLGLVSGSSENGKSLPISQLRDTAARFKRCILRTPHVAETRNLTGGVS